MGCWQQHATTPTTGHPERHFDGQYVRTRRLLSDAYSREGRRTQSVASIALSQTSLIISTVDPNAVVIWLLVIPRRRLQFVTPEKPGSSQPRRIATCHSVILIRSPLAGNLVLDPTMEQYGHPREHRFIAWKVYKARYILRKSKWIGKEVYRNIGTIFWHMLNSSPQLDSIYWRDVQRGFGKQFRDWLKHMQAGHEDLRQSLDDDQRCAAGAEKLKVGIAGMLQGIRYQPAFQ